MRRHYCIMSVAVTAIITLLCSVAFGIDASPLDRASTPQYVTPEQSERVNSSATYTGTLRVFVTDNDRWDDNDGDRIHNALVGIPIQQSFTLNDGDSLMWDTEFNYYGLTEAHTTVVAAIYNSYGYQGYSVPPNENPFIVHEVDASAEARCGTSGYNIAAAGFTHSVLVEEGSTTW